VVDATTHYDFACNPGEKLTSGDATGNDTASGFDASQIARKTVNPAIVFPVEQWSVIEEMNMKNQILDKRLNIVIIFTLSLLWLGGLSTMVEGATSNWPMFKQNLSHTGYTLSNGPDTNNLLWKIFINATKVSNASQSSPVVEDGVIYVGKALSGESVTTGLIAINVPSREIIWEYITGGERASVVSTPAVSYDRVYFGSGDFSVYCVNKTNGELIWKYPTESIAIGSPAVYDGKVYIASFDGNLYALDATTNNPNGELVWKTVIGNIPHSSPAIVDNMVYIGSGGPGATPANLSCLNASTGEIIWEFTSQGGIYASPAIVNGILYFNSDSGFIYALNSTTGELIWSYEIGPNGTSPSVAFGRVFTMNDMSIEKTTYGDRYVYCFNALNGDLLWRYNVTKVSPIDGQSNNPKSSPAISADGKLFVGIDGKGPFWPDGAYQQGSIICLNATTDNPDGELIWEYELGEGVIVDSSPAIADEIVYISASDGYLYAFGQESVNRPPDISLIPSALTKNEGETITKAEIELATDPDGDPLTYTYSDWLTSLPYTTTYDDQGTHTLHVDVSDGTDTVGKDITVTVNDVNRAPVLDPIGNKSVDENTLLTFTVNATDPDGDALTYSASNLPQGASFDSATRIFSWTPAYDQAGIYPNVHFEVSDGIATDSEDITITVNNVNRPPVLNAIGNKSVNEGETLSFTVSGSDPDGDNLTYSASNLPQGAGFNSATRTFSWTPTYEQAGTYPNVHFEVSDGIATDSEDITITVNNVNRPPILNAIGNTSVNEGQNLSFTVSGSDPDGDNLTYSASNLPQGAGFNSATRTFSWTPTYDQAGIYPNVHFEVSDGTATDSEDITITVNNVNRPPVLNAIGNKSVNEGQTLSFTVSGSDPDGDTLTYSASNLPTGGSFNAGTRTFSWTPTYEQAGIYPNVHFVVTDGSLSDSEDITITVINVNRPPVLESIGDKSINEGQILSFTVSGSDPDGDTLTYSASNLPTGASFNAGSRTFSWTPTYEQTGIYPNVHFEVTDGSLSDSEDITITVNSVNRAPTADDQALSLQEDNSINISLTGSDPDGDSLTYTIVIQPEHGTLSGTAPNVTYEPDLNYDGTDSFTFKVNDGTSDSNIATISLTINPVNDAPELSVPDPIKFVVKSADPATKTYKLQATDPDGDTLTYSATGLPSDATLDPNTGELSWTITLSDIGNYPVTFTVSDGVLQDTETITVTVTKAPDFADKPNKTELKCYNNVFNPTKGEKALIVVEIPKQAHVRLNLYNTRGNKVRELADEEKEAGTHKYYWDGKSGNGDVVGSGVYFVHIQAGDYKKTKKIVVVK